MSRHNPGRQTEVAVKGITHLNYDPLSVHATERADDPSPNVVHW